MYRKHIDATEEHTYDIVLVVEEHLSTPQCSRPAMDAFEAAHDDAMRGGGVVRDGGKRKRKPGRGALGAEDGVEAGAAWAKKVLEQADVPGGLVGGMDDLERAVADPDADVERM